MAAVFSARRVRNLLLSAAIFGLGAAAHGARIGDDETVPVPSDSALYLLQDTRPADAGATKPAGVALQVTVAELTGIVSASVDEGKTWARVKVGATFGPGTLFRTGLRSALTCKLGTNQMFTLESLSTIRVEEAVRNGAKEKTDLLMKYGSASYGIEAAGREYDAVIRTPGSTMAIRGTVVRVTDRAGFAPQAESYTGRALFRTARGSTMLGGRGYTVANAAQGSAADTALANSSVDPSIAAARTRAESAVVAEQLSQGGVLGFDQRSQIAVVRNTGPLPDSSLPSAIPGRLSFALRWTGNADLNFLVDNQAGNQISIITNGFKPTEILYPGFGLNTSASGGLIPFDNRGGAKGGTEVAYWKNSFPIGVYGVGILHASGGSADFRVNAFLDGKVLPIYTFDAEGNLARFNTLRGTVGAGEQDGAILFVPRNSTFEDIAPPGDGEVEQAIARAIAAVNKKSAQNKVAANAATAKPTVSTGIVKPTPKVNFPKVAKPADAVKVGPTVRR
jgi:hypothetical protein